ncbi:MAG: oligosaccharide flippase family protein, partial [Gammaproteobacteria bacterium]
ALDSENFGFYMYTVAFGAWLSIFVDYGFGFSGTRSIAHHSKDTKNICVILNDLIAAKILISIFAILICVIFYFISPIFNDNFLWLIIGSATGILTSFVPLYYFQGMETLRKLGLIEASINLLNVLLVVVLVKDIHDLKYLFILMIMPRLLIVICSYLVIHNEINFRLKIDFSRGIKALSSGFYFALFQISNGIYSSFNIIFIGFFVNPTLVGIYATCERLIKVFITFIGQAAHIVFPRVISLSNENKIEMNKLRKSSFFGFSFLGIFFVVIVFVSSDILGSFFLPNNKLQFVSTLRYMCLVLLPISIATVYY